MQNKFTLFSERQYSLRQQEILVAKINGGYISRDQIDRLQLTSSELLKIERSIPRLKGGFGPFAFVSIMLAQYAAGYILDEFVANPIRQLIEGDRPNALELIQQQLNKMEESADVRARLIIEEIQQNFANQEIMITKSFKLVLDSMSLMHTDLLNNLDWRAARFEVNFHINRIFGIMDSLASIELVYRDIEVFRTHLDRGFHHAMVDIQVIFRQENIEQLLLAASRRNLYLVELQKRELVAILQASFAIELMYIHEFGRDYDVEALNRKYQLMAEVLKNCIDRLYGTKQMWFSLGPILTKKFFDKFSKEQLIVLENDFCTWKMQNYHKGKYDFKLRYPTDHSGGKKTNTLLLSEKNGRIAYSIHSHSIRVPEGHVVFKETPFLAPNPFTLDTLQPFYSRILEFTTANYETASFDHCPGLAEDVHFFHDKRHTIIYPPPTAEERRVSYFNFVDQLARENGITNERAQEMRDEYLSTGGNSSCILS